MNNLGRIRQVILAFRGGCSVEVTGRKNEKLFVRVSQHAPIFPMGRSFGGFIFNGIERFLYLGDFWTWAGLGWPEVILFVCFVQNKQIR